MAFQWKKTTAQVFGVKIFFSETGYESGSHVQLRVPSIPFYPIVFPVDSRKYPSISQNFPKKHPHNPIIVLWNTHHSLPMTSALSSIHWKKSPAGIPHGWWYLHSHYIHYPLVNVYIANWKIIMFNGKIHYFDWVIFNSELLNYQRVYSILFLWYPQFPSISPWWLAMAQQFQPNVGYELH